MRVSVLSPELATHTPPVPAASAARARPDGDLLHRLAPPPPPPPPVPPPVPAPVLAGGPAVLGGWRLTRAGQQHRPSTPSTTTASATAPAMTRPLGRGRPPGEGPSAGAYGVGAGGAPAAAPGGGDEGDGGGGPLLGRVRAVPRPAASWTAARRPAGPPAQRGRAPRASPYPACRPASPGRRPRRRRRGCGVDVCLARCAAVCAAATSSPQVPKRWLGFLASPRLIASASASGIPPTTLCSSGGDSLRCASRSDGPRRGWNGGWPARQVKSVAARAYWSAAGPTASPRHCSGAA